MSRVSVVIPTRQRRDMVKAAVESVLHQTRPPDEVIVVDDGSTDGTAEMLMEIRHESLTVVASPPVGVAEARNLGIRKSSGDLIAFCDSDDLWRPDKLEKQLAYFAVDPKPVMVYSDALEYFDGKPGGESDTIFSKQTPFAGDIFESLLLDNYIPTSAVIVMRRALDETTGFKNEFCPAEDYGMWLQISKLGRTTFHPEPLAVYNRHAGQAGRRLGLMYSQTAAVIKSVLTQSDLNYKDIPGLGERLWTLGHAAAACMKADGDDAAAVRCLDSAVAYRPGHLPTRLKRLAWSKAAGV